MKIINKNTKWEQTRARAYVITIDVYGQNEGEEKTYLYTLEFEDQKELLNYAFNGDGIQIR